MTRTPILRCSRSTVAAATVLSCGLATAGAADPMSREDLLATLRGADGEVVVLMAGRVDLPTLDGVLDVLAQSAATSVRLGFADGVTDIGLPVHQEVLAILDDRRPSGWTVCLDWLLPLPGEDASRAAADLIDRYGGSIMVFDDGPNDRERFHPEIGEDPVEGMAENPILFGLFDIETPWGVVSDPDLYRGAWQAIDGIIATDDGC